MISGLVVVIDDDDNNDNDNPLTDASNRDNRDGGGSILLLYDVKIYLCGGNWQVHTSCHTFVMLEVNRRTFGWGW